MKNGKLQKILLIAGIVLLSIFVLIECVLIGLMLPLL